MSNPRVVCNVGVWLTWVNVLTIYPVLLFKEQLRAPVFGRPWKVNPLSYGSIILYRRNFRPVPGNENRSLNCTAGAIILLKRPVDVIPSFPSLSVLRQRIGYTADLLVQSHKNFIDGLQGLMDDPIRLQHVRCPLDIQQANVTSPAWTPFFLTDLTVSATPDLVSIIHGLQEVEQHTPHRIPLLVDENIHYRVLRLVYSLVQCAPVHYTYRSSVWHMAPIKILCSPVLQKILPFIYLFLLWFTQFGHCSAQLSETHLYGAYDSGALALGP